MRNGELSYEKVTDSSEHLVYMKQKETYKRLKVNDNNM